MLNAVKNKLWLTNKNAGKVMLLKELKNLLVAKKLQAVKLNE